MLHHNFNSVAQRIEYRVRDCKGFDARGGRYVVEFLKKTICKNVLTVTLRV